MVINKVTEPVSSVETADIELKPQEWQKPIKYTIIEQKLTRLQKLGDFVQIVGVILGFVASLPIYLFSENGRKAIDNLFHEFSTGVRQVKVLEKEYPTSKTAKNAQKIGNRVISGIAEIPIETDATASANKVQQTAKVSPIVTSATGEVTRANLAEHMQQVASNYYGQPFPHYDDLKVEHNGKEILWKSLSPQEKFDVVYEYSLPHNKPKLMKRENFLTEQGWVNHIENRLLRGSHNPDGSPFIPLGLENDPRQSHGTDHGMRVGIFSAVYAGLYNKYDPNVNLTPEDILTIQLAGAYHDSGRQTEGVDVHDKRSADNAAKDLKKWGFSEEYVKESSKAISDKDAQKLSTKHVIAKCVQCADSSEYARVGTFNPKFLDIYKEFNGYATHPQDPDWKESIPPKPLKGGKALAEFNQEINEVNVEMNKLMNATGSGSKRAEFSQPGKNYYSEILKLINPMDYPKIHAMFTDMGVIGEPKIPTIIPVTSTQIEQAQQGTTVPVVVSPVLEKTGELFPGMLTEVKVINAHIGGSTGAKLVEDTEKRKYVQKTTGAKIQPDHLRSEYHTNKAYKVLGVNVPEVALYHATTSAKIKEGEEKKAFVGNEDKPVMLSKFVAETATDLDKYFEKLGLKTELTPQGNGVVIPQQWKANNADAIKAVQDTVKKDFVADCLLANWDVAGLTFDNIKYDPTTKTAWRIDNGSGLDFRAQGGKKPQQFFTPEIQEFNSLRNPNINPNTSFLYETITDQEIIDQIDAILPKRDAFLATIPDHLKTIMGQRFDDLTTYKNQLVQKKDALPVEVKNFIDKVNKDMTAMSISDLQNGLDAALKVAANIKNPHDKTTLWVVTERLAQYYTSNISIYVAVGLRMVVAQAISPAPPLGDLQIQLQTEDPKLGLRLHRVDTSLFKNQTLAVQRRKYTDGKTRLHIDAKITHPSRAQLQKTLNQIAIPSSNLNLLFFNELPKGFCTKVTVTDAINAYEGRVTADGKKWTGDFSSDIEMNGFVLSYLGEDKDCKVINFEGVGKVKIGTKESCRAEYNRLTIDLDPNISEADAAAKLNIIFAALGLGAASSSSREEDIERIKVMQLFRAYYPKEAYTFERDQKTFEEPVGSLKKRIEATVSDMKNKFKHFLVDHPEDLYQQEVYPGQSIWAIKGLAKEVKNAGGMGLMAGLYGDTFNDAAGRLASMLKSGSLSSQDRFQVGIIASGTSSFTDLNSGGGESVFTRLVTDNMSKKIIDYPLSGKIQVLYDLDLVERVGYAYGQDKFGTKDPQVYQNRSNIVDLTKSINANPDLHEGNEICIRNRIPPEFVKGIRVDSTLEKNELVSTLKAEGLVTKNNFNQECINGIPVDEFIHVGDFKAEYWA